MIVSDARVLIFRVDTRDGHHHWALNMFIDTAAEVRVHPAEAGKVEGFLDAIKGVNLDLQGAEVGALSCSPIFERTRA